MRRGRKPHPARRGDGTAPVGPDALPRCPAHLNDVARREWRRIARPLYDMGVLTTVDRGALAAYCQAYARWVEAEEQLKKTPALIKTPSGYVQQSPWLSVANKQLEIMGRYMVELGITPSARSRVTTTGREVEQDKITLIKFAWQDPQGKFRDEDGKLLEDDDDTLVIDSRL